MESESDSQTERTSSLILKPVSLRIQIRIHLIKHRVIFSGLLC